MIRTMRTISSRDWDFCGYPKHIIWWQGDVMQSYTTPRDFNQLSPDQQARELGTYYCRNVCRAYVAVRICWNAVQRCYQVEAEYSTRPVRGPGSVRFDGFDTLAAAMAYARQQVIALHRLVNKWESQSDDEKQAYFQNRLQRAAHDA